MLKICLALFLILVVVKADTKYVSNNLSPELHVDDYINLHRQQNAKVIKDYDVQIEDFREIYLDRLYVITVQLALLTESIDQNEKHLNALELRSDSSRECIAKYRNELPTAEHVENQIFICGADINDKSDSLLYAPFQIRKRLQQYYDSNFEEYIKDCANTTDSAQDYISCIFYVTDNASDYTIQNQYSFSMQMDASECTAKANLKNAYKCNFAVHTYAISQTAKVNEFMKRCLFTNYECSPCKEHNCSKIHNLKANYTSKTMQNPFFGLANDTKCVMLKVHN